MLEKISRSTTNLGDTVYFRNIWWDQCQGKVSQATWITKVQSMATSSANQAELAKHVMIPREKSVLVRSRYIARREELTNQIPCELTCTKWSKWRQVSLRVRSARLSLRYPRCDCNVDSASHKKYKNRQSMTACDYCIPWLLHIRDKDLPLFLTVHVLFIHLRRQLNSTRWTIGPVHLHYILPGWC